MHHSRFLLLLLAAWFWGDFARGERPNILIAIADDWSYGHAGILGCDWVATPSFDLIAREGVRFERAYTPNAKCAPSRACLLTGRNSWRLKEAVNHVPFFPPEFRTFPEALATAGYQVGFTGKGWAPGVALDAKGEPRELTGPRYAKQTWQPPASGISNNDYAANFLDFLNAQNDQPWCFWYGALEPHRAYEEGVGARLASKKLGDIDRVPAYWPDTEAIRNDMLDYAYEVEHFDRHLGRMLQELDQRGERKNTIVIVTSDHGMPFPRCKGQAYEASNHIPLAIRWPAGGVPAGQSHSTLISLIDIAPSLLEAADLDWNASGMAPADGRSLLPLLAGKQTEHRNHVLIGKERHDVGRPQDAGYPIRGIVTKRWLYLRNYEPDRWPAGNPETGYLNCDGSPTKTHLLDRNDASPSDRYWRLAFGPRPAEELYDLLSDPDCVANLLANQQHAAVRDELSLRMQAELLQENDPRVLGAKETPDGYPYANSKHRNYYSKWRRGVVGVAPWVEASDYRASHNPVMTADSDVD